MNFLRLGPLTACSLAVLALMGGSSGEAPAEKKSADPGDDLRQGKNYISTPTFTREEDDQVLLLYAGLRVADVCDGMDKAGLRGSGLMSTDIHPLWKDTLHYTHRFAGIAVTARYVPSSKPAPGPMAPADYDKWEKEGYSKLSPEPFVPLLRTGSALVIEDAPAADVGSIGSNNIMGWKLRGCVGVVTSATARDTDEITTEKIPLYFKEPGRGIRPGRNEIESVNRPIVCGGVLVVPGDVIVADGDGVIVVPRAHAERVARFAREVLEGDKAGRRGLYRTLGLPEDDSVK
jgi:4-hydroxy-4-methyl-2-oxoglutarate aldolase